MNKAIGLSCRISSQTLSGCFLYLGLAGSLLAEPKRTLLEFGRDIRPVLSENCYPCHGPDEAKRKAKLRLDRKDDALRALPNGDFAIVPGQIAQSKLIERVTSKDEDEVMPPTKSGKKLTQQQIDNLRRWIAEGATWPDHWAFAAPERRHPPTVKHKRWVRNDIDRFVLVRLEQEGLQPMPEAELPTLLRRASLDLTGLPPSPSQIVSWSRQPDPLSAAVDELLASPHFGERMASDWMDVARYADTHGFNNDVQRSMWRWRDWVIEAFNRNLPYNQFITEQLAGDLLPNPSLDQLIATGFNRNHGINSEGGIIDEEYRVEYVVDRVRTTSLAWLGLTMECARCHDHKFDPITQKDFYRFYAFFNNIDETGEDGRTANAAPILSTPTRIQQQQMAACAATMASAEVKTRARVATHDWADTKFEFNASECCDEMDGQTNQVITLDFAVLKTSADAITNRAGGSVFKPRGEVAPTVGPLEMPALLLSWDSELKSDSLPKFDAAKGWAFLTWLRRDKDAETVVFSAARFSVPPSAESYGEGLEIRLTESGVVDVRLVHRWPGYSAQIRSREKIPLGEWRHLLVSCDGSTAASGLHVFLDGEECFTDALHDDLTGSVGLSGAARIGGSDDAAVKHFSGALADLKFLSSPIDREALASRSGLESLRLAANTPPSRRTANQSDRLRRDWLEKHDPQFLQCAEDYRTARSNWLSLERQAPTTMVMRELPEKRPTFVLARGQYDHPREAVESGVPEFLLPFPKDAPRNRLGLAQWLTDPRHPLTARVVVNRFWQSLFGNGIVKSSENFGFQGDWPAQRELLDWLAMYFVDSGWDVKKLLRLIVTSATYRQDSRSSNQLNERDPDNQLLAHGPRQRLTAEMLRDQALFISRLLQDEIGGPSVYPYQPTNLYKGIVVAADYPGTSWVDSKGANLYRRSLYTFWKRTVPHPTFSTFDEPDREVCTARRPKTNTPLQALALMNDTIQLEAARNFAIRVLSEGGLAPEERLRFGFQLATARKPKPEEIAALNKFFNRRLTAYQADPASAKAFLSTGESTIKPGYDPIELAAYANVANLILNLDETISRN